MQRLMLSPAPLVACAVFVALAPYSCFGVDSTAQPDPQGVVLTITAPSSLPPGTEASPYVSPVFTITGNVGAVTWYASGLPIGMSMSPGGTLGGTPAIETYGTYSVTITVRDSANNTGSLRLPLTIQLPSTPGMVISPSSLPAGAEIVAYGPVSFTVSGATGAVGWSIYSANLYFPLQLSSGGVLSGTPTGVSAGTYSIVIYARDSAGHYAAEVLSVVILPSPISIITFSPIPTGTEDVKYPGASFVGQGGTGDYTFSATGLPSGMQITPGGYVWGTPAIGSRGTYSMQISVHDNGTHSGSATFPLTILAGATVNVTGPVALPVGTEGTPYPSQTFSAFGGTGSYTWTASSLPSGLSMSSSGTLSGTPASGSRGGYNVQVTVRDAINSTGTASLYLTIQGQAPSITGPASLSPGTEGVSYGPITFTATGGDGAYSWTSSGLPTGLSISTGGVLSGTPTVGSHGAYAVHVSVLDPGFATGPGVSLQITIQAPKVPGLQYTGVTTLPIGTEGLSYGPVTLTAAGGTGGYTWSASGLPGGLSVSAAGVVSGTPATGSHGGYSVQVIVHDSANNTASVKLTLVINAAPTISIAPSLLPVGTVGVAYGPVPLTASGGTPPYTWSAVGGLPPGLTLSAAGVLSGTPVAGSAATYSVTVTVRDADGLSGSASLSLTIQSGLYVLSPSALANATEGAAYGPVVFSALGGSPGYTWSATGLPGGLSMSSGGILSGTPAIGSGGFYSVQVTVRDSNNTAASAVVSLTVLSAQRITITGPLSLSPCDELVSCLAQRFAATGGTSPYTWSAAGLPIGVSLTSDGILNGAPASGSRGTYSINVTVRDTNGFAGSTTVLLTINAPPQISGPLSLPVATAGMQYGPVAFSATAGTQPYTWSPVGALPSEMTLSSAGLLSGTPTAGSSESYPLTIQVSDSFGLTAKAQLTLTVQTTQQPLVVTGPLALAAATESLSYGPVTYTATGGTGGYSWSATGVPAGLTFATGGVLSGTPALGSNGTYNLQTTVRDSGNNTASAVMALTVNAAAQVPAISVLSPNYAFLGGPAFTLTVAGSGFRPGAVVQWNNSALTTTFTSSTQLSAQIPASLILSAGSASVTITNPGGTASVAATFTIIPAIPVVSTAGVVNAASSLPAIAPGTLISIYGANLALSAAQPQVAPLPTTLGGTSVSINGTLVPLLFVSPGQINAQVPYETAPGTADLLVQSQGANSAPVKIQVAAIGPGVLTAGATNHILAMNDADGSLNQEGSPATTGSAAPASPFSLPEGAVQVAIGGQPAYVQFAGLAPYFVGLLQLNVQIPNIPAGEVTFSVMIGGVAANDTVISVGNN